MHTAAPPPLYFLNLNDALLAHILSFCDASDLIHVLDCENSILTKATHLTLSNATSLHLSFLLQLDRCRNHGSGKSSSSSSSSSDQGQEHCVERLLNTILLSKNNRTPPKLQRLELSGLRHVAGNQGDWLSGIFGGQFSTTLTTIDFSGCALLDPRKLHEALVPRKRLASNASSFSSTSCSSSIRYLNFQGCYRIDSGIVMAIAKSPRFRQLEHLGLGGCSQSIADHCVLAIVQNLKQLRSLDLSGLKRITDAASEVFQYLPDTLENLELAGCELIRFSWLSAWGGSVVRHLQQQNNETTGSLDMSRLSLNLWQELHTEDKKKATAYPNWIKMNFSGIGTPRRGLVEGALSYLALRSMGSLREVYLSGCEQVQDWEIVVLATVCANSLTCLEMRACCIGDDAIRALGIHCSNIADLDVSACFQITDQGIVSFCQQQGVYKSDTCNKSSRTARSSTMRSLKLAALPQVTDQSMLAISALDSLLVLDVHNCPKVTSEGLTEALNNLQDLVELDAKGIGQWSSSAAAVSKNLKEKDATNSHLRFINGRPCCNRTTDGHSTSSCDAQCSVRQQSKRLLPSQGVLLQPMFHCLDCKLTPQVNRGMCLACSLHCHQGHQTFAGSFTRFYCDCPFGITPGDQMICRTISDKTTIRIASTS